MDPEEIVDFIFYAPEVQYVVAALCGLVFAGWAVSFILKGELKAQYMLARQIRHFKTTGPALYVNGVVYALIGIGMILITLADWQGLISPEVTADFGYVTASGLCCIGGFVLMGFVFLGTVFIVRNEHDD